MTAEQTQDLDPRFELARLIEEHQRLTGDSLQDIAKRGNIPKSTVQFLRRNGLQRMPERSNLEKLAAGLGHPDASVVRAAAQTACGWTRTETTLPSDPKARAIIAHLGELDERQLDSILALVEHWRRDNR
ncbi:transcriptional regulator [Micromonospora sp. C51]|uniref:transcriptional regulator n=1 Tax=Micromonospora sp. C51 TaxID=2824879 RepID=UPI001B397DC2|nr:transcriptional regulator [Micromonospora sp. C51]MBQ1048504.1 transcriptional regulator [Micromonospora sp. C51]